MTNNKSNTWTMRAAYALCVYVACLLTVVDPVQAQNAGQSVCVLSFNLTATGTTGNLDLRQSQCQTIEVQYLSEGFSAVSLTVEVAPIATGGVAGTFTALTTSNSLTLYGDLPNALTNTISATSRVRLLTPFAFARINATLTGTGTLRGTLVGLTTSAPVTDGAGHPTTPTYCTLFAPVTVSQVGSFSQELIALTSGKSIHVCSVLLAFSTNTSTFAMVYGTGSACGTGTGNIISSVPSPASVTAPTSFNAVFPLPTSNALCITGTGAMTGGGVVSYGLR